MKTPNCFKDIIPSSAKPRRKLNTTIFPHGYGSTTKGVSRIAMENPDRLDYQDVIRIADAVESQEYWLAVRDAQLSGDSITLTKVSNSHKPPRARRGAKGMSHRASQKVKASAHCLEEKYGRECLGFFTATVPGHDHAAVLRVHEDWSRVLKNFKQSVARLLNGRGAALEYCYATEVQERRYRSSGFPYLHLHFVFVSRKSPKSRYFISHSELREAWVSALNSVVDGQPFWNAITDLQPVKKSVVNYLGKYLSKGVSVTKDVIDSGLERYLPSEWWGSAMALKRLVREKMICDSGDISDLVWTWLKNSPEEHFNWHHKIVIRDETGWEVELGYCYEMKKESLELLREITSS